MKERKDSTYFKWGVTALAVIFISILLVVIFTDLPGFFKLVTSILNILSPLISGAVIAFLLANSKGSGAQAIMNLVENAWGCFGAAFGPTILLSLFWRRFNYAGAVAGVVSGAVIDGLWLAFLSGSTGIYEIVPGFLASFVIAVIVTKLTAEPTKEVTAIFDQASQDNFDE